MFAPLAAKLVLLHTPRLTSVADLEHNALAIPESERFNWTRVL